jgi:hypothetical protein
MVAPSS